MKQLLSCLILILLLASTTNAAHRRFGFPLPPTTAKTAGWYTNGSGNWNWYCLKAGDLDGDGKLEFVLVNSQWEIFAVDDLDAGLAAATPASTLLWQINNPAGNVKTIDNVWLVGTRTWQGWHPQSFAVWDLDDDGKCEVIATWRTADSLMRVCVFNGETGALLAQSPVSVETGLSSALMYNVGIANFRGTSRPRDIYYYCDETGQAKAFSYSRAGGVSTLSSLWEHTSMPGLSPTDITGHHASVRDIDGDGRDELVANGALDHDGTVIFSLPNKHKAKLWPTTNYMHSDQSFAGDLLPSVPGIEIAFAACDEIPLIITDRLGNLLVNAKDSGYSSPAHLECFTLGRFCKNLSGLQVLSDPKTFRHEFALTDNTGRRLALYATSGDWGMFSAIDWDGDRTQDEMMTFCFDTLRIDTYKDTVYSASEYGYRNLVMQPRGGSGAQYGYPLPIDIRGDYREEVVYSTFDSLIVLENTAVNPNPALPSPVLSEKYMHRFTQTGFGGFPYHPYEEYAPRALTVSTASLPAGEAGTAYSAQLAAAGGTGSYSWSIISGTLPLGLSLAASGAITGTPSSTTAAALRFRVNDGANTLDTGYTLTILAAPAVDSIRVTPVSMMLAVSNSKPLSVTVYFSNRTTSTVVASCSWTSNNTAIATVTAGVVQGAAAGNTTVFASLGGVNSNSVAVQVVTQMPIDSVVVLQQGLNSYAGCEDIMLSSTGASMDGQGLQVGNKNNNPQAHFLVRFDLSAISVTENILACTLKVKCHDAGLSASSVSVYRVLRDWTEADATNARATSSVNWTTAFCAGDNTDRSASDKIDATLPYSTGWHAVDVTTLAQSFVSSPVLNKGFLVDFVTRNNGWGSGYNQKEYRDSEYGTMADRPKLLLYARASTKSENAASVPATFRLAQNTPNPFNPSTRIAYGIPASAGAQSRVLLSVYDVCGNLVTRLADETKAPGTHSAEWRGAGAASGVYLVRAEIRTAAGAKYVATRKMMLLK